MATQQEIAGKLWDALQQDRFVMLGLDGADAAVQPQPMTLLMDGNHSPFWFFTSSETDLARAVSTQQRAIVTFTKKGLGLFASMRGTLVVDNDQAVMDRLWSPMVEAWFEGRNDPRITLLRLDVSEAQVWLNEGQLLAGVKLMLGIKPTGQDGQDRDTVDLD